MVTLDTIKLKIAKLEKQAAAIAEKQTSIGLEKIRELMHRHGLSLGDIESFVGKKRGRKALAKTANGAAKAARSNTRPVAPKYADPKSGATWSGRGRAPAWIKDVKDRSRFLIDGSAAGAKAATAKKGTVKSAAAKKAGRKAVAKKASTQGRAVRAARAPARKKATPAKKSTAPRKVAAKKVASAAVNTATPEAVSK